MVDAPTHYPQADLSGIACHLFLGMVEREMLRKGFRVQQCITFFPGGTALVFVHALTHSYNLVDLTLGGAIRNS